MQERKIIKTDEQIEAEKNLPPPDPMPSALEKLEQDRQDFRNWKMAETEKLDAERMALLNTITAREAAITATQNQLDAREAAIAEKEAALTAREINIVAAEEAAKDAGGTP